MTKNNRYILQKIKNNFNIQNNSYFIVVMCHNQTINIYKKIPCTHCNFNVFKSYFSYKNVKIAYNIVRLIITIFIKQLKIIPLYYKIKMTQNDT